MTAASTQLLVSVRNAEEAQAALEGGAHIIDVKEPNRGPMGMADTFVIQQVLRAVAGRAPVSAAMGELADDHDMAKVPRGLSYAKIGLARMYGRTWHNALMGKFAQLANIKPIVVAYWDCAAVRAPPELEVLQWAIEYRAAGLLIDTADKSGPGLLSGSRVLQARDRLRQKQIDDVKLIRMILRLAHKHRVQVALAGSLVGERLAQAAALKPDIIAVRTAACRRLDRRLPIVAAQVRALVELIQAPVPRK